MHITFDLFQTVGIAALVYAIGVWIKNHVTVLRTYFIPAPVVGGILCSLLVLAGQLTGLFSVEFTPTVQDFFMNVFFTATGLTCSFRVIRASGRAGAVLAVGAVLFLVVQNFVGAGLAALFGINPLLGVAMGSIALSGGVGSGAAFGPTLEQAGAAGGTTVGIAAATFGLLLGSLIGGPVAKRLIRRHQLASGDTSKTSEEEKKEVRPLDGKRVLFAAVLVLVAGLLGSYISGLLALTGLDFPYYVGCLFGGLIIRNLADLRGRELDLPEIDVISNGSLNLFLSLALMTLGLGELAGLALPMIVILLVQTAVMATWAYVVTFRTMGRDYEAAVMAAGHCGVGLGQTPNAIANMASIIERHGPAPKAWVVLPVITVVFINIANPLVITAFINALS
ncbi:sodium/glutamate symporter [Brachybacterium sp. ACRRE]|uniref:sodium/glutamate symporter n=1 Tax=Brachybacterium sp. ACRRE TaxID=2918184 RepID=UPI001EF25F24|nr:sodium/glutamate symporter [Brachybacterium sp. ACRRE]MCG7310343.1 sodium/glutamate symporter [Brachybacterium sp. ACRRE]